VAGVVAQDGEDDDFLTNLEICNAFAELFYDAGEFVACGEMGWG
jgi:hypothetical protein